MRNAKRNIITAGLLALASRVAAQVANICPETDVCFKLNIPQSTASSGNGDIFFQISAPATYEYVALGQGNRMAGSNIFVVYTSGNGNNVTLSPRLVASGHQPPQFNSDAEVTLLEGSGVSAGKMVANVRCSSCNSWSGGSASFSGSDGDWIYAVQSSGGPKDSTSQSESISKHDGKGSFRWSYASAKGGNSVNPLLNAAGSGSGNGAASSCVPRPASATSGGSTTRDQSRPGRPTDHPGEPGDYDNKREEKRQEINYCDGFTPLGTSSDSGNVRKMLIAHGTLASLAFVIFFPFGAIAIRLASFTGIVWFHAAFQIFAYLVYIVAFGLGIYIANEYELLSHAHPIIGIVVFIGLFFQPIFGFLHHSMYKKYQTRTAWSHIHLWLGRLVITLGIINGGLGFQLAERMSMGSRSGMIAYAVIAGIVWLAWAAAAILGERKRSRTAESTSIKLTDSPKGVSETQTAGDGHPPQGHYASK